MRSADQHLPRKANHPKNMKRRGAKAFHSCAAQGRVVRPTKKAWYAVRAEKTPAADHFQLKTST
jgi:hypothetical protein